MKNKNKVLLLMIISLTIRLFLIFQPLESLLSKFLYDDAFYYYQIMVNFAETGKIFFNEGIPTNGFHPLYMFLMAAIYKLFGLNRITLIYASLIVLNIFNVLTVIFIYKLIKSLINDKIALLASFIWLFNPQNILTSMYGLETPIQGFFVAWIFYLVCSKFKDQRFSKNDSIYLGIIFALNFLTRLDGVLLIFAYYLFYIFKNKRLFDKHLLVVAITITIISAPWLIWNYITFRTILPVSGQAVKYRNVQKIGPVYAIYFSIRMIFIYIVRYVVYKSWPAISLVVFLLFGWEIIKILKNKTNLKRLKYIIYSYGIYYSFYLFIQRMIREYYNIFLNILSTIVISFFLTRYKTRYKKTIWIVISLLYIYNFYNTIILYHGDIMYKYRAAQQINKFENNVTFGSFDGGAIQYFSKFDVINLDGLVNNEVFEYIKENKLCDYLRYKNITYIINENYIERLNECNYTIKYNLINESDKIINIYIHNK